MKKQRNGKRFRPVHIKTDPRNNRIVVTKPVIYKDVAVPVGYSSDGLTKLINKYSPRKLRAAIIHDAVCDGIHSTKTGNRISRKTGDKYFHEILLLDGTGKKWAKLAYYAVRSYANITMKR